MFGLGVLGNLGLSGGLLDPAPWALSSDGTLLGRATLDIDLVNDRAFVSPSSTPTISSLISCTRASPGFYTSSAGVLTLKGSAARTNLILQSQALGTTWAAGGASHPTVTSDTSTAPDGTLTADTVTFTGSNSYLFQSLTFVASKTYTVSVYAKVATGTSAFRFKVYDGGTLDTLSTDQAVTTSWQRFSFDVTSSAGADGGDLGLRENVAADATDVIFWGFQIERTDANNAWSQPFPSAYISTTTVAVTVAAVDDVLRYGDQGLLVEEARANLLTYSQMFDNAAWVKTTMTVAADALAAPDGTTTADSATASGANSFLVQNGVANATNAARVFSVWLARKTGTGTVSIQVGRTSSNVTLTAALQRFSVLDTALTECGVP